MDEMKLLRWEMVANYYMSKYLWPVYRNFVKRRLSRRCTVCSLNENYVRIEDNVCDICRAAEGTAPAAAQTVGDASKEALHEMLIDAQGKGSGQYDAILYFSGGKDSIYLAHELTTRYKKLRLLALTVDNGFRSPFGKDNAEKVCRHLGLDHMEIRPYNIYRKLYRYGFERFSDNGFYCIDFWEGELFQDIGRNLAVGLGVPLLILGYTTKQIETIPDEYDEYKLYTSSLFAFKNNQRFTRESFMGVRLKDIFTDEEMKYWWNGEKFPLERIPVMVFPFQAWGYNKSEVEKKVAGLGIVKEIDPMLTNDLYCTLGVYLDYKKFGYCSVEPEWAKLVREGKEDLKTNRNLWELIEYYSLVHEGLMEKSLDVKIVLNKLGMTQEDLKRLKAPLSKKMKTE